MVKGLTTRAFNGGLAAFAAGAAGFAVFAMPDAVLGRLANLAGLAGFDGVLRPGLAAVSGALVFLLVVLILRALDRTPATSLATAGETDDEWVSPRLRRADAHPDAPAPRPLLAGKDLGEPVEDGPAIGHGEPEVDADAAAPDDAEPAPLKRILMRTSLAPEETPAVNSPILEKTRAEPPADGPDRIVTDDSVAIEDDAPVAEVPPETIDEDKAAPQSAEQIVPMSLLDRLAVPQDENVGIARLLRRLDNDFGACEWPLPSGAAGEAEMTGEDEAASEDRLRGVLDDLQRMASRNAG